MWTACSAFMAGSVQDIPFALRAASRQIHSSHDTEPARGAPAVRSQPSTKGNIMAQAIMDPEAVRRFAEELKRFNVDLQNRMASLQARFASLGDTWQDQEQTKFAEEFKDTLKALKKFVEVSNQHAPYLLRKAQRIEEYLNQR